jgi:acetylornithine deacetylase/succinyl-diaminopimelate desuccinylase-like protein
VDYTIDAGYMNMSGIPTVMFGAIDMRFCHGDEEFTNLNDTYDISRVYTTWALANAR